MKEKAQPSRPPEAAPGCSCLLEPRTEKASTLMCVCVEKFPQALMAVDFFMQRMTCPEY